MIETGYLKEISMKMMKVDKSIKTAGVNEIVDAVRNRLTAGDVRSLVRMLYRTSQTFKEAVLELAKIVGEQEIAKQTGQAPESFGPEKSIEPVDR